MAALKDHDWLHLAECWHKYSTEILGYTSHTLLFFMLSVRAFRKFNSTVLFFLHIKQYNIFFTFICLKIFSLFSLTEDSLSWVHAHKIQKNKQKNPRHFGQLNLAPQPHSTHVISQRPLQLCKIKPWIQALAGWLGCSWYSRGVQVPLRSMETGKKTGQTRA